MSKIEIILKSGLMRLLNSMKKRHIISHREKQEQEQRSKNQKINWISSNTGCEKWYINTDKYGDFYK